MSRIWSRGRSESSQPVGQPRMPSGLRSGFSAYRKAWGVSKTLTLVLPVVRSEANGQYSGASAVMRRRARRSWLAQIPAQRSTTRTTPAMLSVGTGTTSTFRPVWGATTIIPPPR